MQDQRIITKPNYQIKRAKSRL